MRPLALTLALLALPAHAETPLDGAGFEARVTGRTLAFAQGGVAYGAEQYLPGRRVIWAFAGQPCQHGHWYEPAPARICFVYDNDPTPQCWQFFDRPDGLTAVFEGEGTEPLVEVGDIDGPLACRGPQVGV